MRILPLVFAASVSLSGCSYTRVAAPRGESTEKPAALAKTVKVSYATWDMEMDAHEHHGERAYEPRPGSKEATAGNVSETALVALLKEYGVQDIVSSEKTEDGRLHIAVYELDAKPSPLTRAVGLPWGLVSSFSMFVVPFRVREIHPLEVQIVDSRKLGAERLRVHRVEWIQDDWMWFGFALFKSADDDDSVLFARETANRSIDERADAHRRLKTTGMRRALRPVISGVLAEYK